jgi:hypothetical protein
MDEDKENGQGDTEMLDVEAEREEEEDQYPDMDPPPSTTEEDHRQSREPRESRKDKDLTTFLNQMDKYAPIVLLKSMCNSHLDSRCCHGILSLSRRLRMFRSKNVSTDSWWVSLIQKTSSCTMYAEVHFRPGYGCISILQDPVIDFNLSHSSPANGHSLRTNG